MKNWFFVKFDFFFFFFYANNQRNLPLVTLNVSVTDINSYANCFWVALVFFLAGELTLLNFFMLKMNIFECLMLEMDQFNCFMLKRNLTPDPTDSLRRLTHKSQRKTGQVLRDCLNHGPVNIFVHVQFSQLLLSPSQKSTKMNCKQLKTRLKQDKKIRSMRSREKKQENKKRNQPRGEWRKGRKEKEKMKTISFLANKQQEKKENKQRAMRRGKHNLSWAARSFDEGIGEGYDNFLRLNPNEISQESGEQRIQKYIMCGGLVISTDGGQRGCVTSDPRGLRGCCPSMRNREKDRKKKKNKRIKEDWGDKGYFGGCCRGKLGQLNSQGVRSLRSGGPEE
ncbi:hypothetical protein VP01_1237g2 [Puccinia sorghi]|uniref:Uncharacterized protein n=1 Tax=Puccinia sorghi TaxID=27349 RepID=A0A0L6VR58_9BASI|nr:hypothetical protein VP01_1237g2 [Puccinia sorghi]